MMFTIDLDSPAGRELVDMITNARTHKISFDVRASNSTALKANEGMWTPTLDNESDEHGTMNFAHDVEHPVERINLTPCICESNHVSTECPAHPTCQGEHEDDTLGPCGCVDYHMADCPTRTSYADSYADAGDEADRWYND